MFSRKIPNFNKSLVSHLAFLYAGIFTLLSLCAFSIFYYRIYSIAMENTDRELKEDINNYSELLHRDGVEALKNRLVEEKGFENNAREEFYRLIRNKGEIVAASNMSSWGSAAIYDRLAAKLKKDHSPMVQTLSIPQREYRARVITAAVNPGLVLQLGESLEETEEYLKVFRNLFSVLLLAFMLLSGLIGWFLARRALLGVEQVTHTAREISNGNYTQRVQVADRFEEIKRLGETFNHMLDRIQNLLDSMQEINDNIAHDLRSPLARIRGIAEMTLTGRQSLDDYQSMAASTIEECDNLIAVINTMLDITEAEAGVTRFQSEEFNLSRLVQNACELFRPVAEEKQIDLRVNLPGKLAYRGDRRNLQRIVSNLLENAIKFTPAGGRVSVTAAVRNGRIKIDFEDTGMGIAAADLPRIFERFYRCDRSRQQSGVGLGLSLAKALAEAMGGGIRVESTPNQGSRFTVEIPR